MQGTTVIYLLKVASAAIIIYAMLVIAMSF